MNLLLLVEVAEQTLPLGKGLDAVFDLEYVNSLAMPVAEIMCPACVQDRPTIVAAPLPAVEEAVA